MIFTIGNRKNYLQFIMDYGVPEKLGKQPPNERFPDGYPGGYAFLTMADAERRIQEAGYRDFAVFGLDADWQEDTEPSTDGWWHNLLVDADIVLLPSYHYVK